MSQAVKGKIKVSVSVCRFAHFQRMIGAIFRIKIKSGCAMPSHSTIP